MRVLQDKLLRQRQWQKETLPEPVLVRLPQDAPAALKRLRAAAGKGTDVGVQRQATGLLRRFVPKDRGGVDEGLQFAFRQLRGFVAEDDPFVGRLPREGLFHMGLVPWEDFPAEFRPLRVDVGVGQQLRERFANQFLRLKTEPGGPHDLVLRGRFSKAAPMLIIERQHWEPARNQLRNMTPTDREAFDKEISNWLGRAQTAYANLLRAQARADRAAEAEARQEVVALWKAAQPINARLGAALAGPMDAEAVYLMGLCKHEQAQRMQAKLDLAARAGPRPSASAVEKVHNAWGEAQGWWQTYLNKGTKSPAAGAARRLRGRAQAAQKKTAEALASWRDPSGLTGLEKLANLYLARQLEKKKKD
jgi:hypothetical protein